LILLNFLNKFKQLKDKGISFDNVLDIGAYRGDFTETIKSVYPNAKVVQFEADDRQCKRLQLDAHITLLGNECKEVDFYTIEDTGYGVTTGSSYYREMTPFYKNPVIVKKQMVTLDSLLNLDAEWKNVLIKLDTQGSELDILAGATQFIDRHNPEYMLLECSVKPYNEGAPLIGEVVEYMGGIGYLFNDIVEIKYDNQGDLLQMDVLFRRK